MGILTRTQMESHVTMRIGGRTDMASFVTDSIKMAYDAIVAGVLLPENQETASMNTVGDNPTYTLPTDFMYPVSFRNLNEEDPLQQLNPKRYDEIKNLTQTGPPTHYMWWRNQLTLFPTPDTTYTVQLRYVKRLPELSASTSVTLIPREWDEIIIQGGFYRMLSWLDQGDLSLKEEAKYTKMVSGIMNRLGLGKVDTMDVATPQLGAPTAWRQR